jgi:hypothetical protein
MIGILFLVNLLACLYVSLCLVFATSRRESYVSTGDQKLSA